MTWKCRLHFFLSMSVTIWSLPNQLFTQTNGKKNRTIHKQIKNPKNKMIIEDRILSFVNLFSALSNQRVVKLLSILCPHKCKINTFRLRLKCSQNSLYLSLHSFSIFTFCCETQFGWWLSDHLDTHFAYRNQLANKEWGYQPSSGRGEGASRYNRVPRQIWGRYNNPEWEQICPRASCHTVGEDIISGGTKEMTCWS